MHILLHTNNLSVVIVMVLLENWSTMWLPSLPIVLFYANCLLVFEDRWSIGNCTGRQLRVAEKLDCVAQLMVRCQ